MPAEDAAKPRSWFVLLDRLTNNILGEFDTREKADELYVMYAEAAGGPPRGLEVVELREVADEA